MFLEKRCLFSKVKQNFVNTLHFHKVCKLVQVSFFYYSTHLPPSVVVIHLSRFHFRFYWITLFSIILDTIHGCSCSVQTVLWAVILTERQILRMFCFFWTHCFVCCNQTRVNSWLANDLPCLVNRWTVWNLTQL